MTFPTAIADVITSIATGSLSMLGTVVTAYWPYIIGLGILGSLAYRFRRMFGVAK